MKKILSLLAALGIGATGTSGVISCSNNGDSNSSDSNNKSEETDLAKLITVTTIDQNDSKWSSFLEYYQNYSDQDEMIVCLNYYNNLSFTKDDVIMSEFEENEHGNMVTTITPNTSAGSEYTGSVVLTVIPSA